jgi:hypothetical protein
MFQHRAVIAMRQLSTKPAKGTLLKQGNKPFAEKFGAPRLLV